MARNPEIRARIIVVAFLALVAPAAGAQWPPQWSTLWQHPEPFRSAIPLRTHVAADGAIFAATDVTHHNRSHVALARFEKAGNFAWLREHEALSLAGLALLDGGRVAIAGDSPSGAPAIYIRVYDAASGELIWSRETAGGQTFVDTRHDTEQVAVDASGNLMVLASDDGDYVVIRYDPDGNALAPWRRTIDLGAPVYANGIVALADGGAIITGQGRFSGGGYVTVRLDAQGNEVYTDTDLGGIANPLGPAFAVLDSDGNVVVAAAPESPFGVPRAQVWKLAPDGTRLWTKVLPNPASVIDSMSVGGFRLAANGDAIISVEVVRGFFRLVRLAAATGDVVWDVDAAIGGTPTTLAFAPNGRVLIGGHDFFMGGQVGRIAEFLSNGAPCRMHDDIGMFSRVKASGSGAGWSVLGTTQFVHGLGNDALVRQFDAVGACTLSDSIFSDGFDGQ